MEMGDDTANICPMNIDETAMQVENTDQGERDGFEPVPLHRTQATGLRPGGVITGGKQSMSSGTNDPAARSGGSGL